MTTTIRRNFYVFGLFGLTVFSAATFSAVESYAQGKPLTYEYPELVVTPRASERLKREAARENRNAWMEHMQVQGPALLTLWAGVSTSSDSEDSDGKPLDTDDKNKAKNAGQLGTLVGAGTIAATVGLSALYRPYRKCWQRVRKMPQGSKREKLRRERYAEECLEGKSSMGTRLSWSAAIFNFAAAGLMVAQAQEDTSKGLAALALLGSFAPLMIDYHWETVWDHQQDYKKRVYGPVASVSLIYNEFSHQLMPGLVATISL